MAKRTPQQQTKHDRAVKKSADYYESRGYKVQADINGFQQPESINGRRPDVVAKKDGKTKIVEVETKDSVDKDITQRRVFERYAENKKDTTFRTKVV